MRPLASRLSRLVGQFLDGLAAALPVLVAGLLLPRVLPANPGSVAFVLMIAAALWAIGYLLFSDAMEDGQSYGKRILGIAVVSRDTGEPCTAWQSFVRNFTLSVLGPIDWVFILGERRQRLGDMLAGTIVIQVRDASR